MYISMCMCLDGTTGAGCLIVLSVQVEHKSEKFSLMRFGSLFRNQFIQ